MPMYSEFLYDDSELLIALALFGSLLLASEFGYRLGLRKRASIPEFARAQLGGIQSALAGLFALLLGFTFAMALSRYDERRQTVVREANAIGTAALRAHLLPAEQRAETADIFRRYVDVRLKTALGPNLLTPERRQLDADAGRLQNELWRRAAAAAEADPRSVPAGLLLAAVNELIDVKGERDAALANHVPESVVLLLFGFAVLTSGVFGYGNGLAGARSFGTAAILAVLISLVILVIIDLDRPRRGFIHVSQESMVDLQKSLGAYRVGE
jgi:hypothetical protein